MTGSEGIRRRNVVRLPSFHRIHHSRQAHRQQPRALPSGCSKKRMRDMMKHHGWLRQEDLHCCKPPNRNAISIAAWQDQGVPMQSIVTIDPNNHAGEQQHCRTGVNCPESAGVPYCQFAGLATCESSAEMKAEAISWYMKEGKIGRGPAAIQASTTARGGHSSQPSSASSAAPSHSRPRASISLSPPQGT